MTQVEWSRAVLVYESHSRLSHLLGDLRSRSVAASEVVPPFYVAVRLDRQRWLVARGTALFRELPVDELDEVCARSDFMAQLSEVADALAKHLSRASVFRCGTVLTPLAERPDARFAVVLDEYDSLVWVGERPARTGPGGHRTDGDSPSHRSGWSSPPAEPSTPIAPIPRSAPPPKMQPPAEVESPDDMRVGAQAPTPSAAAPPEPASATAASSPRFLQGNLFRKSTTEWIPAESRLVRKHPYRLDVFIGPPGIGTIQANTPFRDELLDWSRRNVYRLQIVFNEIGVIGAAQTAWVELPRTGTSSICQFEFVPQGATVFQGRISVLHEGRVLQTAVIQAGVADSLATAVASTDESPRPEVEMIVRQDLSALDERRPFDVSLILNHAINGTAAMTAASHEGAYVSSLEDLQAQLAAISELLVELANKSKIHTKGLTTKDNAAWLGRLAAQGNFLFRKLVLDYIGQSPTADALKKAKYLQIVSARPDAVVPLEFVYEYPPPAKGAPVCPNAAKALEEGQCPEQCRPSKSPANCVCPMGFWGLSRVIERHVHDPRLGAPIAIIGSEPTGNRRHLDASGIALLAVSEQVPKADQKALSERIKKVWKGGVSVAPSWESWPEEVHAKKPALFVVLPHTSGKGADIALEIQGDTQECRFIDRRYVCPEGSLSPPIVLLLGCDTASVADKDAYTSNIAVFRQAGSAIVIATTAALVWGSDAARVAGEIMETLGGVITHSPNCFGEILLEAKRRSVRDSQLMAMSLAAFGDADWKFEVH